MINVMIIDDEPEIRRILSKMVERQPDYRVVAECGDFVQAMMEFSRQKPDVVFVDIDLGSTSGLECARLMVELDPKVKIIFATAHSEYMADAFEIYAFDYLVKPFDMERLVRTLDRIRGNENQPAASDNAVSAGRFREKLLIKGKEQTFFVQVSEILFIERAEGTTNLVTVDSVYKTTVSLSELEEKLDGTLFMRCHKSYIVNLSHVNRIEPYGRWTYVVKFRGSRETALMTAKNYEEMKRRFS